MNPSIVFALAAAALFGASTPLAKALGANQSPVLLAGLLYLGSGVGLSGIRLLRDRGFKPSAWARRARGRISPPRLSWARHWPCWCLQNLCHWRSGLQLP